MTQIIYIAALTFHRPEGLARLLSAFSRLERPDNAEVRFLIVDNDAAGSARPIVEAARPQFGDSRLDYVIEPEPGIPVARNRALDEAISAGAELLCFTDDDAWPHPNWLVQLVDCYRKSGAVLVFGPQRLCRPPHLKSTWTRFIAHSLEARSRFVERFAEKESRRGRIATSGTYNWLGNLNWISKKKLRFNPEMQYSGGEDSEFREAVLARNGTMAWCSRAMVFEDIPEDRLSVRYQFRRARVHGMNAENIKRLVYPALLRHPIGRILAGIGLIILPVLGFASFSLGLHQLGMGVGMLQARWGGHPDLYRR